MACSPTSPCQEPIQYRTEWRMTLARDHLRSGDLGVGRSHPGRRRPRGTREGTPAAGTTYQERQFCAWCEHSQQLISDDLIVCGLARKKTSSFAPKS